MATLTSSGVNFSDGTSASGRATFSFPSGTRSVFFKSTAPTGWTIVTGQNNKALRIVSQSSGAGGSSGGSNGFTSAFTNRPASVNVPVSINWSVGNRSLSTNTIPPHNHDVFNGGNTGTSPGNSRTVVNPGNVTGYYGNSGGHNHPVSYTANGPFSTSLDMRVQYCNVLLCQYSG